MKFKFRLLLQKVLCIFCAGCVGLTTVLYTLSFPVLAASTSWEDLGEDAIELRDAYLRYLSGWGNGSLTDIIGGAVDVPTTWFKTLEDVGNVISPVDDWYYYLTDGDEHGGGGGRVHTGGHASHGGRVHLAEDVAPVIPAEQLKKAASYWADYYKPMPTPTQYTWSYKTTETTSASRYVLCRDVPIYMDANGSWGKKNWNSVYILPFFCIDGNFLYCSQYRHYYITKDDNSVYFHGDSIRLDNGEITEEPVKYLPELNKYPYIGLRYVCYNDYYDQTTFRAYTSYSDYMSKTNEYSLGDGNGFTLSLSPFVASDYSSSNSTFRSLITSVNFNPLEDENDDYGFYVSSEPFELFSSQTSIDFEQIPDNYVITINGDTIYDYSITNPDTGDTSTINYYITNNYTLPDNGSGGEEDNGSGSGSSGGSGGSVSGNVDVSGNVNVSGQIDIVANPIDININVNSGSSGSVSLGTGEAPPPYVNGEDINLNEYLEHVPEISKGFTDYLQDFFSWLPKELYGLLVLALVVCIWCRLAGR